MKVCLRRTSESKYFDKPKNIPLSKIFYVLLKCCACVHLYNISLLDIYLNLHLYPYRIYKIKMNEQFLIAKIYLTIRTQAKNNFWQKF